MMRAMPRWIAVLWVTAALLRAAPPPVRVLVIDGVNNHDWAAGTAGIQSILAEAGGFQVDVTTVTEDLAGWNPDFSRYRVLINNFNGGHTPNGVQWPERVRRAFETFVRKGGGFVAYHAANNAFLPWDAYNDMIGLGWREPDFGPGLAVSEDGDIVLIPRGSGRRPGHPPRGDFVVHVRDRKHPVTRGLPEQWRQPMDQLTHGQHGPAQDLTILTWAQSPVSGQREPMDWVRRYGRGRVYVTMLGHTWRNEPNPNLACPEFRRLFAQGVRWAATGR